MDCAHLTVCVCVPSSSGGVQFCSATYRLFKVGPSEQCKDMDMIMEVQYKGRWLRGRGGRWGRGGEDSRLGMHACMEGEERKGERGGRVNGQMGKKLFVGAVLGVRHSLVCQSLCSDGLALFHIVMCLLLGSPIWYLLFHYCCRFHSRSPQLSQVGMGFRN